MACPQCAVNSRSHSFVKFAQRDDTGFWYTGAGRAEELVNTPEKFGYFRLHMNEAKQDAHWVWVFDCASMSNRHYISIDFMKRLVGALSNEHAEILTGIWILNPNIWMRAAVALMSPFLNARLVSKIIFMESTTDFLCRIIDARIFATPWK